MSRNPFQKFPPRGPLKLLVIGDPGTEKTRRALAMPGPRYVIDLENGAADYADLVDRDRDFYLPTKSYAEVAEAVSYLTRLPAGEVGTLVIDPITVVWQSLQAGHVEKVVRRKKIDPADVLFDVGAWAGLKRLYGDLMAALLSAPFHVVMVARGKEKIDERGNRLGYGYEGEKSTEFLANVVIESHPSGDVIVKDRTGTFPSGKRERTPYTAFLGHVGTTPRHVPSDSEAAGKDAEPQTPANGHHPTWEDDRARFCAKLGDASLPYEVAADFLESKGRQRPSAMDKATRSKALEYLVAHAAEVVAWDAERRAAGGVA